MTSKCANLSEAIYSDYWKRWRDVISQHLGHSNGYKSVMAALLKANISGADPGFLEGGFKPTKRGFVYYILPGFSSIFP